MKKTKTKELYNLFSSMNSVQVITAKRTRQVGHVALMGDR